ncbi:integral membrane sensor domain MASE1 [Peribacillus deserti]|uniref:Integral membrane sensor domain MASE1 n=1 Tax=Peribacillus deserti TaxID=673318 RepID=A0ABS2QMC1_9BACI|nr:integral membrane sensor domain MASE1 [Peribacillus deserti]
MSKYLSYVFLVITLILFALIRYGVSLGSLGRAVIIAILILITDFNKKKNLKNYMNN